MARYRMSIDLGMFTGAKFINVPNEEGKNVPGIFIPAAINGIEVSNDNRSQERRNRSGFRAYLNFVQRHCNSKYIEAIKTSLMQRGETATAYNVPAYQVAYMLPEEKRTFIRRVLMHKLQKERPELANQTDTQGTELARAISMMVPFQMGDSYLLEENNASSAPVNTSTPVAQQVSGYTAAASNDYAWGNNYNEDELPF